MSFNCCVFDESNSNALPNAQRNIFFDQTTTLSKMDFLSSMYSRWNVLQLPTYRGKSNGTGFLNRLLEFISSMFSRWSLWDMSTYEVTSNDVTALTVAMVIETNCWID